MTTELPAEHVRVTELPSGAVVVSEALPHVPSVAVGVWFDTGSRHETAAEAGLTHFLEHLLFKGTVRRTARGIAEELDAVGGALDAATGRETLALYARVLPEHLALAADVLCDMILHSTMRDEDIAVERGVVLDEIKSYEDEPGDVVMEQLMGALWSDAPLARPVLGRRQVIEAVSHDRLAEFKARRLTADRLILAAAGRVEHEELVDRFAPLLASLPPRRAGPILPAPVPEARTRITARDQEQVHLALAAPGLPFGHPDRFALAALNNLLGGTASSRLFQEVRESRGLAYSASSWVEAYRDAGAIGVHVPMDPARFDETIGVVGRILDDLASGGVTDAEAVRARDQLKGSLMLSLEGTSSRMSRLAASRMYLGRVTPLAEVAAAVDAITPAAVRALAQSLLHPSRFAAAVLGPGPASRYRIPWTAVPVPA